MTELMHDLLAHLVKSLMLAIRYGLIALFISAGVGVGCRKWPLIKPKAEHVLNEIGVNP